MLAFLESGKMETVGDAAVGDKAYHLFHHVARTGHDKAHVVAVAEHLGGCLDKIFRTFLHGDAAEECHHLVLARVFLHVEQLLT